MLFIFVREILMDYFLAVDQGTTSSRSILFDENGTPVSQNQIEIQQQYPQTGWVEQDPEEIWTSTLCTIKKTITQSQIEIRNIKAIGITNQRETTIVWDRQTGKPIYPAIVWQDRRTSDQCLTLKKDTEFEKQVQSMTGLLIDPYFSALKIAWILDNVDGARQKAENGKLAFGTVDSYLLWHLTNGHVHATDATNASRTMLFNIHSLEWDPELLQTINIPESCLPQVYDSAYLFGHTAESLLGHPIPITGIAGDQQAAAIGQACFTEGMIKSTYGTGCFMIANTGEKIVTSRNKLLTTIAYKINGKATYALEGSIFIAGAAVQWLRDALKLFPHAKDTQKMALSVPDTDGVYLVPAFTGLGAPYWDPDARGALLGLTRNTQIEHIVRAALEAVCYQTHDLLLAMQSDTEQEIQSLRVDGGMTENTWLLQ